MNRFRDWAIGWALGVASVVAGLVFCPPDRETAEQTALVTAQDSATIAHHAATQTRTILLDSLLPALDSLRARPPDTVEVTRTVLANVAVAASLREAGAPIAQQLKAVQAVAVSRAVEAAGLRALLGRKDSIIATQDTVIAVALADIDRLEADLADVNGRFAEYVRLNRQRKVWDLPAVRIGGGLAVVGMVAILVLK